MSKIGEKPISVTAGISVKINNNNITVAGKEGTMQFVLPRSLTITQDKDKLLVKRNSDSKNDKSLHGLYRSLINNAVLGVDRLWEKQLEVVGTGFNVKLQGDDLVFKLGYSHPVVFKRIEGIKYKVEGSNKLIIAGVDKQLVGQVAYQIKIIKKPDVYKGKGIKYMGEKLRIKPGKKVKTAGPPA